MGLLRQRRTGSHFLFEKSGPFIKSNWRPPSMYSFFSPLLKKRLEFPAGIFLRSFLATTRSRVRPRIVDNNIYLSVLCAGSQRQHDIYSTHLRTPADRIVCAKQDNRAQKSEEWSSFSLEPICFGCQTLGLVYILRWAKTRARWRKRKTVPSCNKRINERKERSKCVKETELTTAYQNRSSWVRCRRRWIWWRERRIEGPMGRPYWRAWRRWTPVNPWGPTRPYRKAVNCCKGLPGPWLDHQTKRFEAQCNSRNKKKMWWDCNSRTKCWR